jgi:hypothetical protein
MNILDQAKYNLIDNFNQPVNAVYYYWIKIILGTLYLWKFLSRDFSNIALWPEGVILGYPVDIYTPDYILTTGIFPIFDLVTFHFVHWILPLPNSEFFSYIQALGILCSILFVLSPAKYSRKFAAILYVVVAYLWGFVFRLGQDIDAVFLIQSSLLMFVLLPYSNTTRYYQELRFLLLCMFVIYYFFSGVNKLIDLSYLEWLKYDLVNINKSMHTRYLSDGMYYVPLIPIENHFLANIFNQLGALLTYVVHLAAPLLLFSSSTRKLILYWAFYSLFHFMTVFVGILFSMNFVAWALILPIYRLYNYEKK